MHDSSIKQLGMVPISQIDIPKYIIHFTIKEKKERGKKQFEKIFKIIIQHKISHIFSY